MPELKNVRSVLLTWFPLVYNKDHVPTPQGYRENQTRQVLAPRGCLEVSGCLWRSQSSPKFIQIQDPWGPSLSL